MLRRVPFLFHKWTEHTPRKCLRQYEEGLKGPITSAVVSKIIVEWERPRGSTVLKDLAERDVALMDGEVSLLLKTEEARGSKKRHAWFAPQNAVDRMKELIELAEGLGHHVGYACYSTYINVCFKAQNAEAAEKALVEMAQGGIEVKPTLVARLLRIQGQANKVDEMLRAYYTHVPPLYHSDGVTKPACVAMNYCTKYGRDHDALGVVDHLLLHHVDISGDVVSCLVRAAPTLEKAKEWQQRFVTGTACTWLGSVSCSLEGLIRRAPSLREMEQLADTEIESGRSLSPEAYHSLISTALDERNAKSAQRWFTRLMTSNVTPLFPTFEVICKYAASLHSRGNEEEGLILAEAAWDRLLHLRPYTNTKAHDVAVQAWCRSLRAVAVCLCTVYEKAGMPDDIAAVLDVLRSESVSTKGTDLVRLEGMYGAQSPGRVDYYGIEADDDDEVLTYY
eukprot:Sspe_Gene.61839::Locus_34437_Transcript_1_1_Confidence_1.000_Length_1483::g.61839::m.61839